MEIEGSIDYQAYFKERRKEVCYSHRELCRLTGLHLLSIQTILGQARGRRETRLQSFIKVSEVLGLAVCLVPIESERFPEGCLTINSDLSITGLDKSGNITDVVVNNKKFEYLNHKEKIAEKRKRKNLSASLGEDVSPG